jgi:TM2 domain-containing membrane protein YozV
MEKLSLREEKSLYKEIENESKSKGKAYELLLISGGFGGHWFYLDNKLRGYIHLILGILAILWDILLLPAILFGLAMGSLDSGETITLSSIPMLIVMVLVGLGPNTLLAILLIRDLFTMNTYIEKLNTDLQDSIIVNYIFKYRYKDISNLSNLVLVNPTTKIKTTVTPEFLEQHFINLEVKKETKDKTNAYILLLFFGILGGHWFYLGNKVRGFIQMAMFIVGVTLVNAVSRLRWEAYFDRKNMNLMSDTYYGLSNYEIFLKSVSVFGYMLIVILVIWIIIDFFKISKYIDNLNNAIRDYVIKDYMLKTSVTG